MNTAVATVEASRAGLRPAWWAVVTFFLLHGLIVATWVSRIPAVQAKLQLNNGILGAALLGTAVGAVISIPFTGMLVNRFGSKLMSGVTTPLFCVALIGPALAFNAWSLGLVLLVFGATAAAMDVSMNAQAVEVEKRLGQATMSRFHGMFSLGAMAGAGLGGSLAAHGLAPLPHFAGSAVTYLVVGLAATPLLLRSGTVVPDSEHRLPFRKIPKVLFALSAIGFCMLLSEGAMADWIAIYLKQALHAGVGKAATGYAVFSASMAIFRFLGDWITTKLGPLQTVRISSLLGAGGLLWALSVHSANWSFPGLALTGAGFSVIIPLVFGSGGRIKSVSPGAGIATVTGLGYLGFIIGPPAIGFASQAFTLRYALGIVVACCLITTALSGALGELKLVRDIEDDQRGPRFTGPA